jgi:hypothetical protein
MSGPGIIIRLEEPSALRFAVIILALLAMILGPISGPASAHGTNAGHSQATAGAGDDCGHGPQGDVGATAQDHCRDGGGICADASSCRHIGCMTGGPVPEAVAPAMPAGVQNLPFANTQRPDGQDVAPPLDPPIRRA